MLTAPDRFVMVSIADARAQWVAKDRLLRTVLASGGMALTASDLNTGAAVGWRDGDDPDTVALRIKERVPGVNVQLPSELSRLLRSSTAFFSALLAGIGALAFVIGGLSLANTMAAAVFERIRDFGVKRALGATDWQLGREVLAESLAVTMLGGLGGIAVVTGPSGSGKSTLLNVLGLLEDGDGGEIWFEDTRVSALGRAARSRARGRYVGFLFQSFLLLPALTALENVLLAARYVGRSGGGTRRRAIELMQDVGVGERMDHFPAQLSGGEQQRVAFCRAVLNDP